MLMNIILTVEVIIIIPIMGNMIGIKEMSQNNNHINHRVSDNNGHDRITFSFDVYFTLNQQLLNRVQCIYIQNVH